MMVEHLPTHTIKKGYHICGIPSIVNENILILIILLLLQYRLHYLL